MREIIAGYCQFSLSKSLALALEPSTDISQIICWLEESSEARKVLGGETDIPVYGLSDISEDTHYASLGQILGTKILAEVRDTLGAMRQIKNKLNETAAVAPRLDNIARNITDLFHLEKTLNRIVSPEGELLPNASDKLASLHHRLRTKRAEIMDRMQSFIQSETTRRYIQEPIITERGGRFSIAVKAEYKGEIKGIVHDVSNSGATLFVEPFAAMDLGNEFKEMQIEEAREIERILTEASILVGSASHNIIQSLNSIALIDLTFAKARYARRARAIEASVYQAAATETAVITLDTARHPLLGDTAVPLSIELGNGFSTLVITGPNTGGKTVALKTIGLLCLMTQAGLPVPVKERTRIPVLKGIFADIGDSQSVQEALSTFSGHMSNISRILKNIQPNSLVLLDELGSSTDPQEGSALARAILLHLNANGALAVATSHFTDLKVFAHVTPGLQNASFDFNPETLTPTYHLTLGLPGGSNAIATAARFGLPEDVIESAKGMLSEGARQLEELLTQLQSEKQRLEDVIESLSRERDSIQRQNKALDAELLSFREEKQAMLKTARDTVIEQVAELQKELRRAKTALEHERSLATLASAREVSSLVRSRLEQGIFQAEPNASASDNETVCIGDRVWLKEAEIEATVASIAEKSDQIEVTTGSLRFKLNRTGLIKMTGIAKKIVEPKVQIHASVRSIGLELDLRGKRADAIETMFDEYLNDAVTANLTEVRIIHGFGTGAIRSMVREQAAVHPLVKSFYSAPRDQGGDGATVICLK